MNYFSKQFESFLKIFSFFILVFFFGVSFYFFFSGRKIEEFPTIKYIDTEEGFAVDYPKGWKKQIKEKQGVLYIEFLNPSLEKIREYLGFSIFSVRRYQALEKTSLEIVKNFVKEEIEKSDREYETIKEEKININGLEAEYLELLEKESKEKLLLDYKIIIVFLEEPKTNRYFFLFATAPAEKWDYYQKLFEKCIFSFEVF